MREPQSAERARVNPLEVDLAVVGVTVLAPCLAGSTELWAQSIVILLGSVLMAVFPSRQLPSRGLLLLAAAFLIVACLPFLPGSWFHPRAWEERLVQDQQIQVAGQLTLQPWRTLETLLLLTWGIAWAFYLFTRDWSLSKARVAGLLAGGIAGLALFSLGCWIAGQRPDFWPTTALFGPFPNRNQTANVLVLPAVLMFALAFETAPPRRRIRIFWLCCLALVAGCLAINESRAGLLLLGVGLTTWLVVAALTLRRRALVAAGIPILLGLLTGILLIGGTGLDRFRAVVAGNWTPASEFRIAVYHDAVRFVQAAPWCGVGLGNFSALFPLFRDASSVEKRAAHPESDWLWLAAEMGWLAPLLVLCAAAVALRAAFPFDAGSHRSLRLAAFVGAVLFLLHGLVDVPGHRFGSVLPALLLFAIARRDPPEAASASLAHVGFRCFGTLFCVIGAAWLFTCVSRSVLPSSGSMAAVQKRADQSLARQDFGRVIEETTQALRWSPLEWRLYFQRGAAAARSPSSVAFAFRDFQRARFLEPLVSTVPFSEGQIWLGRNASLATGAWKEALRRVGTADPGLYARMLTLATPHRDMLPGLRSLAGDDPERWVLFLEMSGTPDVKAEIAGKIKSDPSLAAFSARQQSRLFEVWWKRGDRIALVEALKQQPAWMPEGWKYLALTAAGAGDFEKAVDFLRQHLIPPQTPATMAPGSILELDARWRRAPDDSLLAWSLARRCVEDNRPEDALRVLTAAGRRPEAPTYLWHLEMELWAGKRDWRNAWESGRRLAGL